MNVKNDPNRYDSTNYLQDYQQDHTFPRIHDEMFHLVNQYRRGCTSALDLCCSTGLLGQRIIDVLKMPCVGVEGFVASSREGADYGVGMQVYELRVTPATLPAFITIVKDHKVDMLVARRAVSEVFKTADDPFGDVFVTELLAAGVHTVVLQGRAISTRSVHPMKSIDEEMAAFKRQMPVLHYGGQFAVLSTKPADTSVDWGAI